MLTYIIQIVLFQILFLAVYDFFLSKETFHKYNRWYLLGTPILSFVLPLIKIPTFQKAMPQEIMILLPEVMLSPQKVLEQTTFYTDASVNYLSLLFWIGVIVFAIIFLIKLFKITRLIIRNETIKKHFYKLVLLPKQNNAFSFFNYIFLGKEIPSEKQETIIAHELIHTKQKHSVDLLFFELLRIIMWFNPMIYFYQHRIVLLHEYISDAATIKNANKQDYFNTLLNQTFEVENISFVNQFYKHSLIKKRIIMMTKNKSNQIKKAKYLLLLPLLASMLIYTSCEKIEIEENQTIVENKEILLTKSLQKSYTEFRGELKEYQGKEMTFTDSYFGDGVPSGRLISSKDLNEDEKKEFERAKLILKINEKHGEVINLALYRKENGRVTIAVFYDFSKMKKFSDKIREVVESNDVPFAVIENVPVFPGCTGTREEKAKCLNEKIKINVVKNFNGGLAKGLGLSKGKKKIWVTFRIDESGNITDVNARAPHPTLKEEAIRVAKLLPKMVPGKQRGKAVGMKYTLPISFVVE